MIYFGVAMILVGLLIVFVGTQAGANWLGPNPVEEVLAALAKDPRFIEVDVQLNGSGEVINLTGYVLGGAAKWEARSLAWRALSRPERIKAIFNNIVSEEADPMPPTPLGYINDAQGWRLMR